MSQPPNPSHEGPSHEGDEPRLRPRPLARPSVDPAAASAFGRPRGVEGSFDELSRPGTATGNGNAAGNGSGPVLAPPTPESLAQAFGRPAGARDVVLQRPDGSDGTAKNTATGAGDEDEDPLWASEEDPWRDPGAAAVLGRPAVTGDETGDDTEKPQGAQLSLPEVLFGRRVKPVALATLAVIALLIGAAGGLVGWGAASTGDELTGELNVAEAEAAKERPAGSIAGIAKRVAPAVVSLEVTSGQNGGVGSGVMIDSDGYVLTNHHVVKQAADSDEADITAVFTDGTRASAEVVGTDPKTDLAVIKVNVSNPVVIQVGKSSDIAPGDSVVAVGSPFGLDNTVTEGIVSAVDRPVTAPGQNGDANVTYDAIQTDAAINPGNSGGALVDSRGALVGINSMIRTVGEGEGGSIGLGFAIPVDQAMRIAEDLISDGKVQHADIGVNAASVSAGSSEGAQVQNVRGQGPAAKSGIKEGDVITQVGERQVRNAAELTVAVREHEVGDTVPVRLMRDGRALTVDVTLGSD
ncbi:MULTISPECIES: trypsin-like peptidase domain-containing protein [Prauserella salsuginis group]|uniref:S1-C subfamily serine protease n=2 Tax=Prauserella salsuginis group TaxID=2893672 RepID=A0A839XD33_9PSEU|nr:MULTISPECIES: trypsin-like peptidase domain-containing protein [Prauserella salsuginis group]MBB3661862.1 S1-C subfamily serine protease [Prauserella sediminis]MCR3722762.1 serine protease, S1-C subfamily, contains C-terminal PDZ domain [Prauserella flava]MCR3737183.1 serine protease, S1-C subfamily, contains C-terminal PDZ domain [Prauserella salsuginis]